MNYLRLILCALVFLPPGFLAFGQDHSGTGALRVPGDREYRDESGALLGHFAKVRQYFPSIALFYDVGAGRIPGLEGDTTLIVWDHPLRRQLASDLLPLFEFNSMKPRNEVLSLPFQIRKGEELQLFRTCGYDFPHRYKDGTPMREVDTAITVPGTFAWQLIVERDGTGEEIAVLDQGAIRPAESWFHLLADFASGLATGAIPLSPCLQWAPDPEQFEQPLRLRLRVEYSSVDGDPYTGRELNLAFRWSPWRPCGTDPVLDQEELEALWKSPVWTRRHEDPLVEQDLRLRSVSVIDGKAALDCHAPEEGVGQVEFYSMLGTLVARRDIPMNRGRQTLTLFTPEVSGSGFVSLKMGSRHTVAPFRTFITGGAK